jgi:neutral amino acid transport system permease protein
VSVVVESPPEQTSRRRHRLWQPSRIAGVALVVLALLWPMASQGFGTSSWAALLSVLVPAGVYAVAAVGLNLQYGYTGLLNFGQVGFVAVGAYVTVLLIGHQTGSDPRADAILPLWAALLAGMGAAALLGLLLGSLTLRLRGDYLAIATIAAAELIRYLARTLDVTGGVFGISQYSTTLQDLRPQIVTDWSRELLVPAPQLWTAIVCWAAALIGVLIVRVLVRSPWAQALRSVREDETAARALGKNVFRLKLQSLAIGGALGGLAGGLLALTLGQVSPDAFTTQVTLFIWCIMLIGGAGSLWGPIAGAIIFWSALIESEELAASIGGGFSGTFSSGLRFVLVGLLIIVVMSFRPQGLFGRKEELVLELR